MKITFVYFDDWLGIYLDGVLSFSDHYWNCKPAYLLIEVLNRKKSITSDDLVMEYLEIEDNLDEELPEYLSDLKDFLPCLNY